MRNVFEGIRYLKMHLPFCRGILGFALAFLMLSPAAAVNLFSEHGIRIEHRVDENMGSQITGILAPLNFGSSQAGQRVDGAAKHETNVTGVPADFRRNWGRGESDRLAILEEAKTEIFRPDVRSSIGNQLLRQMRTSKIANATYVYQQIVYPKSKRRSGVFAALGPETDPPRMTLSWSVSARLQDGYIFSTEPTIDDPEPSIVYARYFSFSPDPALGASTRFQNAGILEFQLRAPDGTPMTDFVQFQTSGEYDPSRGTEDAGDVRFGAGCITKNTGVCPRGAANWFSSLGFRYPDLQSQLIATGSLSGILDYHHPVAPQTNDEGKEDVTVTMTVRDFMQTGCSRGEYRNAGVIERVVVETVSRFATYPADIGPHLLSASERETVTSSTYDKSVQLPRNTTYLQNYGIHPFPELIVDGAGGNSTGVELPHDTLLTVPELREMGVTTIPPIRKTLGMTPESNLVLHSSSAGMGASRVGAGQNLSINFASGADAWAWSENTYDRQLSFSVQNKDFFTSFTLDDLIYDDHTLVYVNGQQIYGGSYAGTTQLQIYRRIENMGYDDCRPAGTNLYDCGSLSAGQPQVFTPQARISAMWCSGSTCQLFDINTGKVEYSPGLFGDHSRGGDQNGGSFNLTQYIQNGVNTIQTRTLSGGGGNLSFRLNSTSCIETN